MADTSEKRARDDEHICCACHAFKPGCCNPGHAAWLLVEHRGGVGPCPSRQTEQALTAVDERIAQHKDGRVRLVAAEVRHLVKDDDTAERLAQVILRRLDHG